MTDADLIAAFLAWQQDIDSEPFSHEAKWAEFEASVERAA